MTPSLDGIDVDEFRLGSASALVVKNYPLDPQNLTGSYFDQLDTAVADFCAEPSDFSRLINEVFEETYREVFGAEPAVDSPVGSVNGIKSSTTRRSSNSGLSHPTA